MLNRLALTFFFVLALLYALPFPLTVVPGVQEGWDALLEPLVPWVAEHVLRIPSGFPRYGGGETTWDYVQFGTWVVIALAAAALWTACLQRRTNYRLLDDGLRIYLRLFLAAALFSYGWGKVLPVQFPALGPDRLSQEFGEASPSGLLWAFMGFSPGYMRFTGMGELAAGLLLAHWRTATLGALVGIAVMSNVVALNFAFDVGVKIGSIFYLVSLVYVALPDAGRLTSLFVLNRGVEPARPPLADSSASARAVATMLPAVLVAYLFVQRGVEKWGQVHQWGQWGAKPPLYGLYDVTSVEYLGSSADVGDRSAANDASRWTRLAIGQRRATVRRSSGTLEFFASSVDSVRQELSLRSRDDATARFLLTYQRPDSATLLLDGRLGEDSVRMRLRRRDETRYRLVSHPFHWVHDTAENR